MIKSALLPCLPCTCQFPDWATVQTEKNNYLRSTLSTTTKKPHEQCTRLSTGAKNHKAL